MYLEHYGLTEPPFRVTPDPKFFFTGAKRGATLDALLYAVTHDEGIVKVSGEVGCGKTMVCRMLLERLPANVIAVYLGNPSLSREDILFSIAEELHITATAQRSSALLRNLQEHLVKLRDDGRQVVLLIDEAHALPVETLEEICMLSNLEANHHNLLQLVLFGQPELNRILARTDMRQLKERITHHFSLDALTANDVGVYLNFRMRAAGYRGPNIFGAAVQSMIHKLSHGLLRRINVLADKSLLAAYGENTHQVARRHVRHALRDSELGSHRSPSIHFDGRIARAALAAVVVFVMLFAFWPRERQPAPALPQVSVAPAQAESTDLAIPANAPAEPATVEQRPPPPQLQASLPPAPASTESKPRDSRFGARTSERIAATESWLATTAEDRWFIQLLATEARSADKIESFVAGTIDLVGTEQVRVYVAEVQGNQRVGVIYGDYPSREQALAAVAQLPEALRKMQPFPRKVKWLH